MRQICAFVAVAAVNIACSTGVSPEGFATPDDACRTTLIKVYEARVEGDELTCIATLDRPGLGYHAGDVLAKFERGSDGLWYATWSEALGSDYPEVP